MYKKGLQEEESARIIGQYFPNISDKLLNLIQLSSEQNRTALLDAGIAQKALSVQDIAFENAIDLRDNKKYLKYLIVPFSLILFLMIINLGIFTQSTRRIVQFNQEFSPQAPFHFQILNKSLAAFVNEDFILTVKLEGQALPTSLYIISGDQRWKMINADAGIFTYTFETLQNEIDFQLEASGFYSDAYKIELVNRPELTQLKVSLTYPVYLQLKPQELNNAGNLEIPEGTKVTWRIRSAHTQKASMLFGSADTPVDMQLIDNGSFTFGRGFKNPDNYTIVLENDQSKNKDQISYSVAVIKDQYPQVVVDNLQDSVLFKSILLGGSINDDYGITALKLNYQVIKGTNESPQKSKVIAIEGNRQQQNFYYQWKIDSLGLQPGDKLVYHLQVWDNDGVNGRKSTRSSNYIFSLPSEEELKTDITRHQQSAENKIDKSLQKSRDLQKSIDEAQEKLRGKQSLDWQDKKMLEDLIKQKEKLDEAIQALQKENALLEQKKGSFSEESQRIREKSEQIQKLMDQMLDEDTKKQFRELEKLLQENADINQVQKMLNKMDRKEINLEKELERTLELFKQLQYDYKLEKAIDDLKNQAEKQEELLKKTENLNEDKTNKKENDKGADGEKKTTEELAKEQEQLKSEFDNFKNQLDELDKLGEELNKSGDTPDKEEQESVKESQEESKESLEKGDSKKSSEKQKQAISKMKEMQKQMEGMQSSMEMEMDMQNLESLRQIIHGLIKLSFDQENLMKQFAPIQQTDPLYVQLGQNQLKLKDDSKVLEDSLLALSKKDAFMGSIVTREVSELNDHIEKAVDNVKERRKANASTEMQLSMTSINNLALMLNDHFDMMMNMMANAMPGKGKKKSGNKPSLGKLQEQLNQQMEEIKQGGKSGRQLSEEFAKMAAEQERIRRALQEMQEKMKQEGGKMPGGDLPGKMEQTEMDLVNKRITEQTIQRQKEILTRLLESEKSMREQDLDEERKGETAKDYTNEIPRAFEEYLRLKEKEVELLKTVPPKLYPYYKQEVGEYFKRIKIQEIN
ncbi:MAG: hypothetical protein KBF45_06965 [Cyclobacteriaceae bacterium]|nr:hypothetical protein [Cyclobacteriaceae bacterium]